VLTRAIRVAGQQHSVDMDVALDWLRWFELRRKRLRTQAVVLHWTAGYGEPVDVHRTLVRRGLSVHFAIGADGDVWQMADLSARCSHATMANATTIGIELCSPGSLDPGDSPIAEEIHGRVVRYRPFAPAQVAATRALVRELCDLYELPLRAPSEAREMTADEWRRFRGVCGHLHVSRTKVDPGQLLLEQVTRP